MLLWGRGGMADASDLKSEGCKLVGVQVPPTLPIKEKTMREKLNYIWFNIKDFIQQICWLFN